ncbi:hypothetical protein GEMRC1_010177 [Eukaryota sp. GEM-RC1]
MLAELVAHDESELNKIENLTLQVSLPLIKQPRLAIFPNFLEVFGHNVNMSSMMSFYSHFESTKPCKILKFSLLNNIWTDINQSIDEYFKFCDGNRSLFFDIDSCFGLVDNLYIANQNVILKLHCTGFTQLPSQIFKILSSDSPKYFKCSDAFMAICSQFNIQCANSFSIQSEVSRRICKLTQNVKQSKLNFKSSDYFPLILSYGYWPCFHPTQEFEDLKYLNISSYFLVITDSHSTFDVCDLLVKFSSNAESCFSKFQNFELLSNYVSISETESEDHLYYSDNLKLFLYSSDQDIITRLKFNFSSKSKISNISNYFKFVESSIIESIQGNMITFTICTLFDFLLLEALIARDCLVNSDLHDLTFDVPLQSVINFDCGECMSISKVKTIIVPKPHVYLKFSMKFQQLPFGSFYELSPKRDQLITIPAVKDWHVSQNFKNSTYYIPFDIQNDEQLNFLQDFVRDHQNCFLTGTLEESEVVSEEFYIQEILNILKNFRKSALKVVENRKKVSSISHGLFKLTNVDREKFRHLPNLNLSDDLFLSLSSLVIPSIVPFMMNTFNGWLFDSEWCCLSPLFHCIISIIKYGLGKCYNHRESFRLRLEMVREFISF